VERGIHAVKQLCKYNTTSRADDCGGGHIALERALMRFRFGSGKDLAAEAVKSARAQVDEG
jgi:hypothetical protein